MSPRHLEQCLTHSRCLIFDEGMNEWTIVTSSLFLYLCSICSSVFQTKLLFWQGWFAMERHFLMAKTLHLKICVSQSEIYVVQEFQECKLRGWGVPSQTNTSLQAPDLTTSSPSLLGQGQPVAIYHLRTSTDRPLWKEPLTFSPSLSVIFPLSASLSLACQLSSLFHFSW